MRRRRPAGGAGRAARARAAYRQACDGVPQRAAGICAGTRDLAPFVKFSDGTESFSEDRPAAPRRCGARWHRRAFGRGLACSGCATQRSQLRLLVPPSRLKVTAGAPDLRGAADQRRYAAGGNLLPPLRAASPARPEPLREALLAGHTLYVAVLGHMRCMLRTVARRRRSVMRGCSVWQRALFTPRFWRGH